MKIGNVQTLHRPASVKRSRSTSREPRTCCNRVSGRVKRRLAIGVVLALISTALCWLIAMIPIQEYSSSLTRWIQENKMAGAVVFPLVYWLLIPLCIPSSMFDLIGGSVFGIAYGVVLNTIGKTGGALIAFVIGKRLGRERVGGYLETNFPAFSAVSAILESDSWKPLLLVQLSTLPHAVKSYGLAITDVSMYRFMVSSFVTALPFTVLLTQIGYQTQELLAHSQQQSGDTEASSDSSSSGMQTALFVAGIVFTIATMVFFVVYTKREIQRQLSRVASEQCLNSSSITIRRTSSLEDADHILMVAIRSDDELVKENRSDSMAPRMTERLLRRESSSSEGVPKQRCSIA